MNHFTSQPVVVQPNMFTQNQSSEFNFLLSNNKINNYSNNNDNFDHENNARKRSNSSMEESEAFTNNNAFFFQQTQPMQFINSNESPMHNNDYHKRRQLHKIQTELHTKTVEMLFEGQREYQRRLKKQQHQQSQNMDFGHENHKISKFHQKPYWPSIIKNPPITNSQISKPNISCHGCEKNLTSLVDQNNLEDYSCHVCQKYLCGLCSFTSDYGSSCCFDCRYE